MKGQNEVVTFFEGNGLIVFEVIGIRGSFKTLPRTTLRDFLPKAPGEHAPAMLLGCKKVLPSVVYRGATTVEESQTTE